MKLEDQVTNLELSKKLKELGVKQDSYAYWYDTKQVGGNSIELRAIDMVLSYHIIKYPKLYISAFTASELGEMLPDIIQNKTVDSGKIHNTYLTIQPLGYYEVNYIFINGNTSLPQIEDKFLANALAKMLIYLIEKNLIILPKAEKGE